MRSGTILASRGGVLAGLLDRETPDSKLTPAPLDTGPDGAGARAIHEGIAGSELYLLKGCGHGVLFERSEEAVGAVIEFLTREA